MVGIGGDIIANVEIFIGSVVIIWFGAMYGAHYVNSHYVIKNADVIALIALVYFIVLRVIVWNGITIAMGGALSATFIVLVVSDIIMAGIFYFGSKKFIKADSQVK